MGHQLPSAFRKLAKELAETCFVETVQESHAPKAIRGANVSLVNSLLCSVCVAAIESYLFSEASFGVVFDRLSRAGCTHGFYAELGSELNDHLRDAGENLAVLV